MLPGPGVVRHHVLKGNIELEHEDRSKQARAFVSLILVDALVLAYFDGNRLTIAASGMPTDLIGRQMLNTPLIVRREVPGDLARASVGAFNISGMHQCISPSGSVGRVVDRDVRRLELRARPIARSNGDQVERDVEPFEGFL